MDFNRSRRLAASPLIFLQVFLSLSLFVSCQSSLQSVDQQLSESEEETAAEESTSMSSSSSSRSARRRNRGGGGGGGSPSSAETSICDRAPAVEQSILDELSSEDCSDVDLSRVRSLRVTGSVPRIRFEDLEGLDQLENLHISGAGLRTIDSGAFSDLDSLEFLNLMDNDLSILPTGLFSGLSNLEVVDLSDNSFSSDEQNRIRREIEAAAGSGVTVEFD